MGVLHLAHCAVDLAQASVVGAAGSHALTSQEVSLLRYLSERTDRIVAATELQSAVLGYAPSVRSAALAVAIRRLRKKIEREPAQPSSLLTVRGVGYRLVVTDAAAEVVQRETPFVGRGALVAAILGVLGAPDAPVLCLTGPPGVGKTRLAEAVAGGWIGPARVVSLRHRATAEDVVAAVGAALGARGDGVAWAAHQLGATAGALWIFDNAEGCVDAVASLVAALSPTVRVVVTSRSPVPGALPWPVPALDPEAASHLFVALARRARPGLWSESPPLAEIGAVAARLDGLPLAIELAAARMAILSVDQIRERLSEPLRALRSPADADDPAHRSLQAAVRLSWDLLSIGEKSAFAQMSVFRGGATIEAAESVVRVDGAETVDLLHSLVSASLLRIDDAGSWVTATRFSMLSSLRAFAARELDDDRDLMRATEVRHGAYFAGWASTEPAPAPEALRADLDNLVCAARSAIGRWDADVAARATLGAWSVLTVTGPVGLVRELVLAVLALGDLPAGAALQLHTALGDSYRQLGRNDDALVQFRAALAHAEATSNRRSEGVALANVALALAYRAPEEARTFYEAALAIHREVGNRRSEAVVLGNLALHLADRRPNEALRSYEAALALHSSLANPRSEANTRCNLATLLHNLGRNDDAAVHGELALAQFAALGDRAGQARAHGNLANLCRHRGRPREALAHLELAGELVQAAGVRRMTGVLKANLGCVLHDLGQMDGARQAYEAAIGILEEVGDEGSLGVVLGYFGRFHGDQGRLEEAVAAVEGGLVRVRSKDARTSEAALLDNRAWLHRACGQLGEARALHEVALARFRALHQPRLEARAALHLGDVCRAAGEWDEARTWYLASAAIADRLDEPVLRGVLLGRSGEREGLARGEGLLRATEAVYPLGVLLAARAELEGRAGYPELARTFLAEAELLARKVGAGPRSELGAALARSGPTGPG